MQNNPHKVHVVRLGCARNDVDAEELAGRLAADGFDLVAEPADADTILVNTCGFIDAAKKDSIDQLLAAADLGKHVVAVGCLAERYGAELAVELPEADVLGFDDYPEIGERLRWIAAGGAITPHQPRDRRGLLPITPVARQDMLPTYGQFYRKRLDAAPSAPLKIASGCDRRCAFCAIPGFRGAYLSRKPEEIVAEARWLIEHGVRELVLVSENTTSYGKDFPGLSPTQLVVELAQLEGLEWLRLTYLQPAELRPALIDTICATEHVTAYFDLPFQHANARVLRSMRRFGDAESFLELLDSIRGRNPLAGIRTNVIVGFPGETTAELEELADFLAAARLDAIGVFGYSDEEGTEAATLPGKVSQGEIAERVEWLTALADDLMAQRAAQRVGERVQVLVEVSGDEVWGRAAHQGPAVDGNVRVELGPDSAEPAVGDLIWCNVTGNDGVDLIAAGE
ncbi:MAG: 30S ribosomal protein S12 methylthiotransferase RimO [Propionibacteriaceae bacterium]|jgi:ribosomal protein S12 methylthiotransferase RimO|nr:30S ribosomal protein S12 methylthiotransferase RimO [Propionibacteriaceae bacterium]